MGRPASCRETGRKERHETEQQTFGFWNYSITTVTEKKEWKNKGEI